ncbi:MAG: AraC family transcriptional regulator [Bacteroidota bacterium]
MSNTILYIKNMVCNRCILVVRVAFEQHGFSPIDVSLGKVTLNQTITSLEAQTINSFLAQYDFQLLEDKKDGIVEQIKRLIIEIVQEKNNQLSLTLSAYLSQKLSYDYNYLSNLFSTAERTTIEQFYIHQKIEKIKELLSYGELSIKEIAHRLHYSSTAHLSNQFRKNTGFTTSQFKKSLDKNRKSIDKL